jgi:hypothetical protein
MSWGDTTSPCRPFQPSFNLLGYSLYFSSFVPNILKALFFGDASVGMRPTLALRWTVKLTLSSATPLSAPRPSLKFIPFQLSAVAVQFRPFSYSRTCLEKSGPAPASETIPLGLFLWKRWARPLGCRLKWGLTPWGFRIQQLGVGTVMGLPGDTNLELLHYIGNTNMRWGEASSFLLKAPGSLIKVIVGNSNELNAAYAADGYSRIKGSPGVSKYSFPVHKSRQREILSEVQF